LGLGGDRGAATPPFRRAPAAAGDYKVTFRPGQPASRPATRDPPGLTDALLKASMKKVAGALQPVME
jgi:hypothetical protein